MPGALRRPRRWTLALLAAALPWAGGCTSDDAGESPRLRGDRAFARGDRVDALAEYRLLLRNDRSADAVLRVAHVQTALGRVEEARALYAEAVAIDSANALQAVSDLVARARDAFANGDSYGGASAMEAALHFQPGVLAEDLLLPLARHYGDAGEHGRAQPLYLRAVGRHSRNPEIVLEAALAHQQIGDCKRALDLFAEFVEMEPRRERETHWPVGSCALQLARELLASGAVDAVLARLEAERADAAVADTLPADAAFADTPTADSLPADTPTADSLPADTATADSAIASPDQSLHDVLRYLDLVIDIEEPRAVLPEAHFLRAGILARTGECEAALAAYSMVSATASAGSGALVRQALERADAIRFAEGEQPC